MKRIHTLFIILAIITALYTPIYKANADSNWINYPTLHPKTAVIYDFDMDGIPEIVLPTKILDNYGLINTPYPQLGNVTLVDINGDGIANLVVYGRGELIAFDGQYVVYHTTIPSKGEVHVTKDAISIGNIIIYHSHKYNISAVPSLIPVTTPSSLYAIYNKDGRLKILDVITGYESVVYNDNITPLSAFADKNQIYIAGVTPENNLIILKYNPSSVTKIAVYTVIPEKILGSNMKDSFYVEVEGKLYKASLSDILLYSTWEPVYSDPNYIYLYNKNKGEIAVLDKFSGITVATVNTPVTGIPSFAFYYNAILLVYPNKGLYIHLLGGAPYAMITSPWNVYVGENFTFKVYANGNYTVMIDGLPVKRNSYIFHSYGLHNITVVVTKTVFTRKITTYVYVEPRPLDVSINVTKPLEAYSKGVITIETIDDLNGSKVMVPCEVKIGDETYNTTSWAPLTVKVGEPSRSTVELEGVCGNPAYGVNRFQYQIPVKKNYAKPTISYLGNGTFIVTFHVNGTNITPNGKIMVLSNNKIIFQGKNPLNFTLPKEGNFSFTLKFIPDNKNALVDSVFYIKLFYAGERLVIPNITNYNILAVDHIIRVGNNTGNNTTETVTVTAYPKKTSSESGTRLVTQLIILILLIPVIMFATDLILQLKHEKKGKSTSQEQSSTGEAQEGEIEFENA